MSKKDQTYSDERLKARYKADILRVVNYLFPDGNNCELCFGRGWVAWDDVKKRYVICDCVNQEGAKKVMERKEKFEEISDAKTAN